MNLTLPIDSEERKDVPVLSGCINYFPAALAGVARISVAGNRKHNKGQPLHHARGKSMDHGDCIVRHTMDLEDLKAALDRWTHPNCDDYQAGRDALKAKILEEARARAWRSLAELQELEEKHSGAPLAPAARLPEPTVKVGQVIADALKAGAGVSAKKVPKTAECGLVVHDEVNATNRECKMTKGHVGDCW